MYAMPPKALAMSAMGLGCVKTCTGKECAELFSLLASPDSGRQRYWFSNRQNRDGISTRKFCVGVFTQPGSKGEILSASKSLPLLSQERTLAGLAGSVYAGGNLTPSHH